MKKHNFFAGLMVLAGACITHAQNASEYNNNAPISGINCAAFGHKALQNNASSDANNSALGYHALNFNNGGQDNSASGSEALLNNVRGSYNSAFGRAALYSNINGFGNSAHGHSALFNNDYGTHNTAMGDSALFFNTSGVDNTAVGHLALFTGNGGNYNTAFGKAALYSNAADGNSAFGDSALYHNTTGYKNTAVGKSALFKNTIGHGNTVIGDSAMYSNTLGWDNVAIGKSAMSYHIGVLNTAVGAYALQKSNSSHLVAIGSYALQENTTGIDNTACGGSALQNNTTGEGNTAIGSFALNANQTGKYNTVLGSGALSGFDTGIYNVAIGYVAMVGAGVVSSYNTVMGARCFQNNTTGSHNTSVGFHSLFTCDVGNSNTTLGYYADVSKGNDTNATAIGADAIVNANNKVRLGDVNITVVEGQVNYSIPSDGRFKTNIKTEDVKGLEFIKKLRPVVYNFDTRKFTEFLTKNMPDSTKKNYLNSNFKASTAIRQSGFIAQEVEQAAKDVGYDFNGVHKPVDDNDNYSVAYSQFVVPLVKGMQEQQQMIDDLKSQVAVLSQQLAGSQLAGNSQQLAAGIQQLGMSGFSMEQNVPNPFTHETVIKYNLPQSIGSAYMAVYDLSGKQLTTFAITQKGASSITITSEKLAAGIYIYSIVADGSILDSKRMVVADK